MYIYEVQCSNSTCGDKFNVQIRIINISNFRNVYHCFLPGTFDLLSLPVYQMHSSTMVL